MHITHLPNSVSQPPCPSAPRGFHRRVSHAPNGIAPDDVLRADGVSLGSAQANPSIADLAWHFERNHHERIRKDFAAMLRRMERELEPRHVDAMAMLRSLRGALEHHFYRSERLLFPEMRRRAREATVESPRFDPVGPVERSNRDLRRLVTHILATLPFEPWSAEADGHLPGAGTLFDAIGEFLVMEREVLLPRCRVAFDLPALAGV